MMHSDSHTTTPSNPAIGMFDSGVGGLTVLKQILLKLPQENILYLGDTARLPYGNKSPETVLRYSIENAIFLIEKGIKILVIACNTATAHSLFKLQKLFHIPIIGVISPGVDAAIAQSKTQHIGVIGTKGTIQSGMYQKALQERAPQARVVAVACPLFTPLVEEQYYDSLCAKAIIAEHLHIFKSHSIDTLLLGCTHYPLLKHLIAQELGPQVTLVDSASTCAQSVASLLKADLLNDNSAKRSKNTVCNLDKVSFFVSDDPETFRNIGEKFLEMPLTKVCKVAITP